MTLSTLASIERRLAQLPRDGHARRMALDGLPSLPRKESRMYADINRLRSAIRAEGTPSIQDAWDEIEEHVDFVYSKALQPQTDDDLRAALMRERAAHAQTRDALTEAQGRWQALVAASEALAGVPERGEVQRACTGRNGRVVQ